MFNFLFQIHNGKRRDTREKFLLNFIMCTAFIATSFFNVNVIYIVIICRSPRIFYKGSIWQPYRAQQITALCQISPDVIVLFIHCPAAYAAKRHNGKNSLWSCLVDCFRNKIVVDKCFSLLCWSLPL